MLPDGSPVQPLDLEQGTAVRDEFYSKATGKTAKQVNAHWAKMLFTGEGRPHPAFATTATVKRLVSENQNAIGYINATEADASVKVLLSLP